MNLKSVLSFFQVLGTHRIHGAGILMLTWLGYIDGIHGTPYIAAPWILWGILNIANVIVFWRVYYYRFPSPSSFFFFKRCLECYFPLRSILAVAHFVKKPFFGTLWLFNIAKMAHLQMIFRAINLHLSWIFQFAMWNTLWWTNIAIENCHL